MAFITPASKLFILSCVLNFSLGMDITNQDFNAVVGTLSHVIIAENQKKKIKSEFVLRFLKINFTEIPVFLVKLHQLKTSKRKTQNPPETIKNRNSKYEITKTILTLPQKRMHYCKIPEFRVL